MSQFFTDYAQADRRLIFAKRRLKLYPFIVLAAIVVAMGWDFYWR